jgi:hypothetical protein
LAVRELANTYLTVMRGTSVNSTGDRTNVGLPVYQHVPAALIEQSKTVFDPAASTRRTIRQIMCVVPSWLDVSTDDTIMDEGPTPPAYYMVESIQRQPSLGPPPELILTLRSRSGVSVATD